MEPRRLNKFAVVSLSFLVAAPVASAQTTIYVDDDAATGGDGTTWLTAYKYLQDALDAASTGDEIHVAGGTYRPDEDEVNPAGTGSRDATFQLASGVELYGGYAGQANPANPDERDIDVYRTALSGDLVGDDGPVACVGDSPDCDSLGGRCIGGFCIIAQNNTENSYQVVIGSGTDSTAVLDGFIVTGGNANGAWPRDTGGGMYSSSGSPTLARCSFSRNSATNNGAGMRNSSSSPTLTSCTFSANSAPSGAGIYNNDSSPTLTDCTFSGNSADHGGGMLNDHDSSPTLKDCTFAGNSATNGGGGMYNWISSSPMLANCAFIANSADWAGAMYSRLSSPTLTNCSFIGNSAGTVAGGVCLDRSSATLTNCIFRGNAADTGGGLYNWADSSATLTNCTFAANSAHNGRAMACDSLPEQPASTIEIANCILWDGAGEIWNNNGSALIVGYSDVQGSWEGEGNISADPRLAGGDLHLKPGSPCIDAGDNASVPADTHDLDGDGDTTEPVPLDLHALPRFIQDPITGETGIGDPPIVDMGAYEYRPALSIADLDGDGDVDLDDFRFFQRCFSGSGPDQAVDPACLE